MTHLCECLPEETTLVSDSQTNKQTNIVEETHLEYLSIRVTVKHTDVTKLLRDVFDSTDYICYKHTGIRTKKEHVHILVPNLEIVQKLRTRLLRAGYKGNESFSIKTFKNGLSCGIQYASKEATEPIYVGEFEDIIRDAPKWVQKSVHSYYSTDDKPDAKLRDWNLNYGNLVAQAVRYAKCNKLGEAGLETVVKHMIQNTKWRPIKQMYQNGVPSHYILDFQFRMGQRKEPDMSWFREHV